MTKPVISVIVPAYNVENYIRRCVESILTQTFEPLEVILVDDGSTDSSGAICDEYAALDSRVRVIHKANGGLSDARNVGIEASTAPLIGFVDSDDYIAPDMFETLYQRMTETGAEISVCGVYDCYPGRTITTQDTTGRFAVDAREAIQMALESRDFPLYVWNKLYKRELFDHLRFPVGKVYEDAYIMIPLLDQTKTIAITMEPKYYYIRRAGSVTTKPYSGADLDIIEAHESNYRYIAEKYPEMLPQAEFRCIWAYFMALDKLILSQDPQAVEKKKDVIRWLRKRLPKILTCQWLSRTRKISALCLAVHERLYKLCVKVNLKKVRQL